MLVACIQFFDIITNKIISDKWGNTLVMSKAILKKMSVGGNISDKKVNRKEGNFYFF